MRHISSIAFTFFLFAASYAQKKTVTTEILTTKQVTQLLPDSIRKNLHINYPIFRVYKYGDKGGQYYCILTESQDEITAENDTTNYRIKAVNVKNDNGSFSKLWEINDNIQNESEENNIWFWTKYAEFKDHDGDGSIEPIIVYGTSGLNGYDDGRIKFIIYYKGQKIAIRHQNGVLDFERETQVDKAFYNLPQSLQASVKQKMEKMMQQNQAIFPNGWQNAMKSKKTVFNEQ